MNEMACQICSAKRHPQATLCKGCKKICDRLDTRPGARKDTAARLRALESAWDADAKAFRCHYSGVVLDDVAQSPWHVVLDHRTPRDDSDIVVCSALVNAMKSNLTEEEFRSVVIQLAERFAGARASIERIAPAHWQRG